MKKYLKAMLVSAAAVFLLLWFAAAASAAPAMPGTHPEGCACRSHTGTLLTLSALSETAAKRNSRTCVPASAPGKTELPLAVIVIGFENQPYRDDFDWAQDIFEGERSLVQYYTDMSFGRFAFSPVRESSAYEVGGNSNAADAVNDGVIHVSLPLAHDDWTLTYAPFSQKDRETSLSLQQTLIAALDAADAYMDYSVYDVNGDHMITTDELAVAFVVGGYEAASSGGYPHGKNLYLWSHAYSLWGAKSAYGFDYELPEPDGVTVDSYICISEQLDDGSQGTIGTLAHELGHYLGLPDLYDTSNNVGAEWGKYGVGYLSLMDIGCYGTDPETGRETPYSLDLWSRVTLGWVEPAVAAFDETGEYTLTAQTDTAGETYGALRINTGRENEYYLLENRSFTNWDAGLSLQFDRTEGGIILWHIDAAVVEDYQSGNAVNVPAHRPGVMPLYPEASKGAYTFIGNNTMVYTGLPFFDKTVWQSRFSSLGYALELPLYGSGKKADLRAGRTLSGVRVQFLTDPAAEMKICLNPGPHVHTPVYTVVQEPTCTEPGKAYYYCDGCGGFFADENAETQITEPFDVDALGHDLVNHEAQAPTCIEPGWNAYQTCTRCDYSTYEALAALDHDYVNHDAKAPTCTGIGWNAYDTCTRCDYSTYEEIGALGHDYVNHEAKAPTCTEIGWNAYDTCTRCDFSTYEALAALGHDYVNHDAKAPTCTEIGWNAYQTCSRCDYSTYEELAALEHAFTNLQHDNEFHWYACAYQCTVVSGKEAHRFGDWSVETPATMTKDGTEKRVCAVCGYAETRQIPKTLQELLFGDVDQDGAVTTKDARLALRRSIGLEHYEEDTVAYFVSDVDFNGVVTTADARLILRAAINLEDPARWTETFIAMQQ